MYFVAWMLILMGNLKLTSIWILASIDTSIAKVFNFILIYLE
jgi:hypothetical protein